MFLKYFVFRWLNSIGLKEQSGFSNLLPASFCFYLFLQSPYGLPSHCKVSLHLNCCTFGSCHSFRVVFHSVSVSPYIYYVKAISHLFHLGLAVFSAFSFLFSESENGSQMRWGTPRQNESFFH